MAEEHGMIEPFEPKLIREKDNQKIVSYGASSYGYDIRCANEFKVFTNINSTIVDPKISILIHLLNLTGIIASFLQTHSHLQEQLNISEYPEAFSLYV